MNMYFHFISILNTEMAQVEEIIYDGDNDQPTLQSQYHGCWWPGEVMSEGMLLT